MLKVAPKCMTFTAGGGPTGHHFSGIYHVLLSGGVCMYVIEQLIPWRAQSKPYYVVSICYLDDNILGKSNSRRVVALASKNSKSIHCTNVQSDGVVYVSFCFC